jgi:hypothetical protein
MSKIKQFKTSKDIQKSTTSKLLDKLTKSLNISSRHILAQLVVFVLLVFHRIKDAYLVDACFLSETQAKTLIEHIAQSMSLDKSLLSVVMIGDDCFIVHQSVLQEKLQLLAKGGLNMFVVELDSDDEHKDIKSISNLPELSNGLSRIFCDIDTCGNSKVVDTNDDTFCAMGAPFLAGFLVGYPIVYHCSCDRTSSTMDGGCYQAASTKLSFTTLNKTIFSLSLETNENEEQKKHHGRQNILEAETSTINIMEFTYPSNISHDTIIKSAIDHRFTQLQEILLSVASVELKSVFKNVECNMDSMDVETQVISL